VLKIVLGFLALGLAFFLLVLSYFRLRKFLELQAIKDLKVKDRVGFKIEFIKTAAQILGGAFFLFGLYFTWANLVVSQEKHKTDLFTKAIEQLGSEKLEVRLGGIYALELIARDSDKDHGPIMEVLTAFVRLHAPWPPKKPAEAKEQPPESGKPAPGEKKSKTEVEKIKPRADIQAILTVLGRRARTYGKGEAKGLDLRQTDLRGADLNGAHLEEANLWSAHLEGAHLWSAHLEWAGLGLAHLQEAILVGAYLEGALLMAAHLEGAFLKGAHLKEAVLEDAHLEKANLPEAHLEGAYLLYAHLEGANLTGADLRDAKGLTKEQIASAIIDKKTKLPDYLKKADPNKAEPK
jgi:hypothetical protein